MKPEEIERHAVMALLMDKVEQYESSEYVHTFIADLIGIIAEGEHVISWEHGEYDDLKERIKLVIRNHSYKVPRT